MTSGLQVELQALRDTDPGMTLLTAVEFVTSDPGHRIALYRRSAEDGDSQALGLSQDDPRLLKIATSLALDLAFLERRARGEGFQVQGLTVIRSWKSPGRVWPKSIRLYSAPQHATR